MPHVEMPCIEHDASVARSKTVLSMWHRVRSASVRSAPVKSVQVRSAFHRNVFLISALLQFAPLKSACSDRKSTRLNSQSPFNLVWRLLLGKIRTTFRRQRLAQFGLGIFHPFLKRIFS